MFIRLLFFTGILLLSFSYCNAQSRSAEKKQKQAEKLAEKQKKEDDKWFENYVKENQKRHFNNQTKAVQKRMKERKRHTKQVSNQNEPSFFQSFFDNRKRKKKYSQNPSKCGK